MVSHEYSESTSCTENAGGWSQVLYSKLGEGNKKMVFLFTDQHVVEEGFLELINNMLTSGMVPALYADDEKESIVGTVREEALAAGLLPTREAIWQFFVSKCSNNLHVVMAMTPVGDRLRFVSLGGAVPELLRTNWDWDTYANATTASHLS